MNRYLVFACYGYYPSGGWSDFKGSSNSLEEAVVIAKECRMFDWIEIVDLEEEKVIMTKSEIDAR